MTDEEAVIEFLGHCTRGEETPDVWCARHDAMWRWPSMWCNRVTDALDLVNYVIGKTRT